MIKVYDKDVFSIDINAYNRVEILRQCWNLGQCENMKFLVYEEGRVIGALSYQNIVYEDRVDFFTLQNSESLFQHARKYFYGKNSRENDCLPVLNEEGECLFLLVFYENKLFGHHINGKKVDDYADLNLKDRNSLDFTLLNRANAYVFFELEEYTFELASLIREAFPERKIFFLDKKARYFFNKELIFEDLDEVKDYLKNAIYITSERENPYNRYLPYDLANMYNSHSVIKSLIWCKTAGAFYHSNVIYQIDPDVNVSGLGEIMQIVCVHAMAAEERGWTPYVNLRHFPNQYLLREGDNMWEYFFENLNDCNPEEKKYLVVSAHENMIPKLPVDNPYFYEKFELLRRYENGVIKKKIKLKKEIFVEIENKIPKEFCNETNRILGVIARGTDLRPEACKVRNVKVAQGDFENLIKKIEREMKIWNCNYLFLATEDEEYYTKLKKKFGNRLLSVNQERIRERECKFDQGKILLSDLFAEMDTIKLAKSYLAVLYGLSLCFGLLANMDSNTSFIARAWNGGKYAVDETIV